MDRSATFLPLVLRVCAGPLIWAAHFLGIYAFTAVSCARGLAQTQWLGMGLVPWVVGGMTVLAVAATAGTLWYPPAVRERPRDTRAFFRWVGRAFSALALVAIVWQTLPAFTVAACP